MKLIALIVFSAACSAAVSADSTWGLRVGAERPSASAVRSGLLRIFSSPERFDGKRVITDGVMCFSGDHVYLFMYMEDYDRFRLDNAFQIILKIAGDTPTGWREKLHGRRVMVEGQMVAPRPGMVAGGGSLQSVSLVHEIRDNYVSRNE